MPRDDGPELRDIATLVALHALVLNGKEPDPQARALEIGRQVAYGLESRVSSGSTSGGQPGVYTEDRIRRFKELFFDKLVTGPLTRDAVEIAREAFRSAWEKSA